MSIDTSACRLLENHQITTNLVTASTTFAKVSPHESGTSEKRLQLVKVWRASRATSLKGPARKGANKMARNGSTSKKGSITSASVDQVRIYHETRRNN